MIQAHARRAFSLIELVIVVVIIGIIGAIAIPRMSRGAEGASDSALVANLAVLRNAIDLFVTEHEGTYPLAADVENALLQYSNLLADDYGTKDAPSGRIYGPYLRAVPPLPVGAEKGSNGIAAIAGAGVGWIYDQSTGSIRANTTTETDVSGKLYSSY
jgi:prepilin-type N-terminal cleavage/methylation domain-containing protein